MHASLDPSCRTCIITLSPCLIMLPTTARSHMPNIRLGKQMLVALPFLPFPLPSLLPNALDHKHLLSSTLLLLPPHPPGAAGQRVTDQVDQLPTAWGPRVCRRGLVSWGFAVCVSLGPCRRWHLLAAACS